MTDATTASIVATNRLTINFPSPLPFVPSPVIRGWPTRGSGWDLCDQESGIRRTMTSATFGAPRVSTGVAVSVNQVARTCNQRRLFRPACRNSPCPQFPLTRRLNQPCAASYLARMSAGTRPRSDTFMPWSRAHCRIAAVFDPRPARA